MIKKTITTWILLCCLFVSVNVFGAERKKENVMHMGADGDMYEGPASGDEDQGSSPPQNTGGNGNDGDNPWDDQARHDTIDYMNGFYDTHVYDGPNPDPLGGGGSSDSGIDRGSRIGDVLLIPALFNSLHDSFGPDRSSSNPYFSSSAQQQARNYTAIERYNPLEEILPMPTDNPAYQTPKNNYTAGYAKDSRWDQASKTANEVAWRMNSFSELAADVRNNPKLNQAVKDGILKKIQVARDKEIEKGQAAEAIMAGISKANPVMDFDLDESPSLDEKPDDTGASMMEDAQQNNSHESARPETGNLQEEQRPPSDSPSPSGEPNEH